jgi:hypothetical protein
MYIVAWSNQSVKVLQISVPSLGIPITPAIVARKPYETEDIVMKRINEKIHSSSR